MLDLSTRFQQHKLMDDPAVAPTELRRTLRFMRGMNALHLSGALVRRAGIGAKRHIAPQAYEYREILHTRPFNYDILPLVGAGNDMFSQGVTS